MKVSKKKLGIYALGAMVLLVGIIATSRHTASQIEKSAEVSSHCARSAARGGNARGSDTCLQCHTKAL